MSNHAIASWGQFGLILSWISARSR